MSLYDLLKTQPEQLDDKKVQQLISFAGSGKLADGNEASVEFRKFLEHIPTLLIARYVDECLSASFENSGFALQDLVNEIGRRLGFHVTNGRYRGKQGEIGFDGLWRSPEESEIVVEVKTTDAYRIDLNILAEYRRSLIKSTDTLEDDISILIVVGRKDTGDLEAQIRGSKHAWDVRLISADALMRLIAIKEEIEDPTIASRIRSTLVPREYTRLDDIIDLVFSTTEDIKLEEGPPESEEKAGTTDKAKSEKRADFHPACAEKVASHLDLTLLRRAKTRFSTPDDQLAVVCAVSKQYEEGANPGYWFAYHPSQRDWLSEAETAFVCFGCGSPEQTILIPMDLFDSWLSGLNQTHRENGKSYWHVIIEREDKEFRLVRKAGESSPSLTSYVL